MRRGRRLFYALTPSVLILLIAVSPAVPRHDRSREAQRVGAAIRDVDASLASLSAGVAERIPVPSVWPMQAPSVDGVAALTATWWPMLLFGSVLAVGCVGLIRRDRAPPRLLVRF
jgi:hypothetical protein